jgi:hypothetical protein
MGGHDPNAHRHRRLGVGAPRGDVRPRPGPRWGRGNHRDGREPAGRLLPAPDGIAGMAQPIDAEVTETLVSDGDAMVHAVARNLGLGEARTRVLIGQPGPELCRLAAEESAELLVF